MSKLIIPLGLIFASIATVMLLVLPAWQHFLAVRADSLHLQDINAEIDRLIQKRDAIVEQMNAITKDDFTRLNEIVPETAQTPEFLVFINKLAEKAGLKVRKLDVSGTLATKPKIPEKSDNTTVTNNITAIVPGGQDAKYKTINIGMEVAGSYEAFKNFLRDAESSVRITDISLLTFASGEGGFNFQIGLKTYYQ